MKANEYIQKYDHAILVVHSRKHGPTEYKIDLSDVGLASEYQWNTWVSASGARYAKSSASKARKSIKLHRLLTDFKFKIVDHADNDSTNNRRSNLRDATNSINGSNCKMYKNNSSGYRGVSFHKQNRKFTATISYNNKQIHLGSFNTDKEASDAYEAALERYHGYDVKIRDLEAELESIKETPIYYKNVVLEGEVERLEAKLADISERAFNSEHEYKAKLAEAQAVYNSLIDCAARDTLKINELKAKIALLESDNNFSLGKRVVELVHEKFELEAKLDSYIKMRDELIDMNKIKEEKLAEALNGTVLKRYNEAAIVQFGGFGYLNEIK